MNFKIIVFLGCLLFLSSCKDYTEEIKSIKYIEKEVVFIDRLINMNLERINEKLVPSLEYRHYPEGDSLMALLQESSKLLNEFKSKLKKRVNISEKDFYLQTIPWNSEGLRGKIQRFDTLASKNKYLYEKLRTDNFFKYKYWESSKISYGNLVLFELTISIMKQAVFEECMDEKLYRSTLLLEHIYIDSTSKADSTDVYIINTDPKLHTALYSDSECTHGISNYDTTTFELKMSYSEFQKLDPSTKFYLKLSDDRNNELKLPFTLK